MVEQFDIIFLSNLTAPRVKRKIGTNIKSHCIPMHCMYVGVEEMCDRVNLHVVILLCVSIVDDGIMVYVRVIKRVHVCKCVF